MKNHLVSFLIRLAPGQLGLAVMSSILAGASTVALFAFIFSASRPSVAGNLHDVLTFAALAVVFIASRSLAALAMTRVGRAVVANLRRVLIRDILRTPYRKLEAIGTTRLLMATSADVQVIANAAPTLVGAITNFAIVVSLFIYIAWLSPMGACIILAVAGLGVPIYWILIGRATRISADTTRVWERLYGYLDGLVSGVKQLRLNRGRASMYLSREVAETEDEFLNGRDRTTRTTTLATNAGQSIFLMLVGSLLFINRSSNGIGVGVEFFFATIYLMGPLDAGVGAIASLVQVNTVFRRNQELGILLSSSSPSKDCEPEVEENQARWETVRFSRVTYAYEDSAGFAFGPVDLLLRRGDIVFVKGGNGSGKSTFAKILSGLYYPTAGSISLDHRPVTEASRQSYRELFCCIFDDAHIFERIWSSSRAEASVNDARDLIKEWSLERSVDVSGDRFTNTRALSRGQKKKLLLISATLEDRDICVFDEWAADQDAPSRRKFYYDYLPRLKRAGKLVIVLTHDEGFDAVADQIIKFQDGKLVAPSEGPSQPWSSSLATSS